jgi:hypothetical protein
MDEAEIMDNGYKFRFEYEMLQNDEDHDDNSKIRLITYGDTAKEAAENHGKMMRAWEAFLEKEARKTSLKDKDKLK